MNTNYLPVKTHAMAAIHAGGLAKWNYIYCNGYQEVCSCTHVAGLVAS
ncbi:hypothetical protein [Geitlerinema sp. PCC 9228]|nr:hypothetical protein [Geitlerinema sp. PCC 9228]